GTSAGRDLCDLQLQCAPAVDEEAAPGREVRPTDPPQAGAEQRVALHVARLQQEAPSARLERLGEHVRLRPRGRFVLTDHELALAGARPDQLVQIVLDTAAGEVRDAVDEQGEPALPHGAGLDRLPQLSGEL